MALILNIETATKTCSVSIAKEGSLLALKEKHGEYSHAENLTAFIQETIKLAGIELNELDAIAVSKGPGSYTGLRIGVSTAKGLCFALNKPLLAVNTLEAMATHLKHENKNEYILCPMLDARRMEVYCAILNHKSEFIKETAAEIISIDSFSQFLKTNKIIFFGDGAQKCESLLSNNENAFFATDFEISSLGMVELSETAFQNKQFENVAYFEPYYLKDFVTTTPKKLV